MYFFLLHFLVEGIKNYSLFWHQYSSIFSSEIIRLYFHIQVLNLLKKKRCVDLLTIRNKWIGRHAYLFYNLYDSSHIWNFKRDAILSTVCCIYWLLFMANLFLMDYTILLWSYTQDSFICKVLGNVFGISSRQVVLLVVRHSRGTIL